MINLYSVFCAVVIVAESFHVCCMWWCLLFGCVHCTAHQGHRRGSRVCVTRRLKWVSARVLVGLMMMRVQGVVLQVRPSHRLLVCHHWAAARTPALVSTRNVNDSIHTHSRDKANHCRV